MHLLLQLMVLVNWVIKMIMKFAIKLKPLNPYGDSKNEFDKWVLHQEDHPPFWAGLKFFNVYGPNEYHKGEWQV